jgi:UDP-2-acetamido-2-deoxy-ribo-hexuluronate aminotransferase
MIKCHNLTRRYNEIKNELQDMMQDMYNREKVTHGYYANLVEIMWQKLSGRKHAILTNSCSMAFNMTALLLGLKQEDEVITTAYSCPASETYIHLVGAKAVFCDVDDTGNMDTSLLEDLITEKTKIIVGTGMYGDMHDHKTIKDLCDKYNLIYLNDAAQSMFSTQDEIESTTTGDIVCMSLAENKPMPSLGSCGALLTDNTEWYYNLLHLHNHGKPRYGRTMPYTHFGIRAMADEEAAIQVLCSSKWFDIWQTKRKAIASFYDSEFDRLGIPIRPRTQGWNTHKYPILFNDKLQAQKELKQLGIETEAQYTDTLPKQGSFPNTDKYVKQALSIPINAHLDDLEVEEVVKQVEVVWKKNSI